MFCCCSTDDAENTETIKWPEPNVIDPVDVKTLLTPKNTSQAIIQKPIPTRKERSYATLQSEKEVIY
jgi:hypothetical protein